MNIFEQAISIDVNGTAASHQLRTLEARSTWKRAKALHDMQPGDFGLLTLPKSRGGARREILTASNDLIYNLTRDETYSRRPVATTKRVTIIPKELVSKLRQLGDLPV